MHSFIYYWHIEDELDDQCLPQLIMRAYGMNEKGENMILHIKNFTPWIYLEIKEYSQTSERWIQIKTGIKNKIIEKVPSLAKKKFYVVSKKKLYFYHNQEYYYFKLRFSSMKNRKQIYYALNQYKFRYMNRNFMIQCHEYEASPLLQLICSKNLHSTGWINFNGHTINSKHWSEYSEYTVDYEDIKMVSNEISVSLGVPSPNVLSFDIEVYSHNWQKMPESTNPLDQIFQICCICEFSNKNIQKFLITFENLCPSIVGKDVHLIPVFNEKDLLLEFTKLVRLLNPHVLVGYNIFGFDIPYMIQRAKYHDIYNEFNLLGIPLYVHGVEKEISWSSSAYSYQEFHYLETEGRLYIDLLPVVKRDYKFNNYKLKTVSTYFLGETKDPLTAIDIFKAFAERNNIENGIQKLSECGKYCVQDGYLVLKLYQILQLWIGLTEMAKICNVPISFLFTKGQQIKVYSQVYKKCYEENIIIESNVHHDILDRCTQYAGAHVFTPQPSLYDWVVPFDFSSLYPTIIIAYNIDYSTFVVDESKVDLKDCNVLEWEDHINCEHDLEKKKGKITKHLCQKNRFVFKKEPLGVIPTLLQGLLDARADTKKLMKSLSKNDSLSAELKETMMVVYDKRQLAYKVSANSMYGGMGVLKGYLPFMPGAMSVTAMGRHNIQKAAEYVKSQHQGHLIYGDSIVADTPIVIKNMSNEMNVFTVEELFLRYESKPYEQFKSFDLSLLQKEQSIPSSPIYIYSKTGWSSIHRIIRHYTTKKIYRIVTTSGIIDVTEDHSLVLENGDLIPPTQLQKGNILLTYSYSTFWNALDFDLNIMSLLNKIEITKDKGHIKINLDWTKHKKECMLLYLFFNKHFESLYIHFQDSCMILSPNQYFNDDKDNDDENDNNVNYNIKNGMDKLSYQKGMVLSVCELTTTTMTDFVYDIETEEGVFHAGIGNLIVKNTDSIYCHFKGHNDAITTWNKAKEIEKELLQLFPKPMKLVFEEKLYKKFLILTKKRYMAYTCDDKGEIDEDLTIRGVLLARRDNCKWIRDFYEIIVRRIMDNDTKESIIQLIGEKILELFQWKQKNLKYFTVTKLVNKNYKSKPLPIDLKKCKKRLEELDINEADLISSEQLELINQSIINEKDIKQKNVEWVQQYIEKSKPAHVQLAEKMKRRGKPVEAGSRIEYVIVTHPNDPKTKLYDKIEDPSYFKMHRDILRLDSFYYLKNLITPLDQLLGVVFKDDTIVLKYYRYHIQKQKVIQQIENYPVILFIDPSMTLESSIISNSNTKKKSYSTN